MSKAEDVISSGSRKEIVGVQRKDNKKQDNSLLVYGYLAQREMQGLLHQEVVWTR
jgi:hypothetical protein